MAREVIKKGTDVRAIREPINDAFASLPVNFRTEGAASSKTGDTMSFSVAGPDLFYIKLDAKTGTSPIKYAWTMMVQDRTSGAWTASPRTGVTTDDSYAVELNNASLTTGTGKRYAARVNPHTGRVTFDQGGTGGSVDIKSGETVLMILGTYDEYKDCPGVPPKPPTTYANPPCDESRTSVLCVDAFAYAVYQRCGYVWNKVGDTRDYQVWANELNGQSFGAWRRFVIPRWGGDVNPSTGLPDPLSDCMGVAFLGAGAGSAITCSCPSWASTGQCILVRYTVIPRPFETGNGGYTDCADVFTVFDAGDAEGPYWGRTFEARVDVTGNLCNDSSNGTGPLTVSIVYEDTSRSRCYWGPDVFDPCDPCAGFGRFYVSGEINGVEERPNCGSVGHFTGYLSIADIKSVICGCATVSPRELVPCNGCDGNDTLPPLLFIDMDSIEVTCCPEGDAVDGGTPLSLPTNIVDGGGPGILPTDIIDGGTI